MRTVGCSENNRMTRMQTHAKDERVGVDSYYRGVEFYDRFIESFALGKQ